MARAQFKEEMNIGKLFETQIKKSVPDYALLYRLPDPPQSFGGGNLRFSSRNPFDLLVWDLDKSILYDLEMKTVEGKSIWFERSKEEKGEIQFPQIAGLNEWSKYDGIICGFVIEFRKIEKTVFIKISEFNKLINAIPKKSFNYDDLEKYGVQYVIIEQQMARTLYTYNMDKFLQDCNI